MSLATDDAAEYDVPPAPSVCIDNFRVVEAVVGNFCHRSVRLRLLDDVAAGIEIGVRLQRIGAYRTGGRIDLIGFGLVHLAEIVEEGFGLSAQQARRRNLQDVTAIDEVESVAIKFLLFGDLVEVVVRQGR